MAHDRILVIFGADGDLSKRLLMPGLAQLLAYEPARRLRLVGAGMSDLDTDAWLARLGEAMPEVDDAVRDTSRYVRMDVTDETQLRALLDQLDGPATFYFAVPPAVAYDACVVLQRLDVPRGSVLALEKPFGTDLAEAQRFDRLLEQFPDGVDAFRVDHFLGKMMVLSIIGMRFANRMIEGVWSAADIERIEIIYDEDLALEGRAGYYDKAGALRDMLQSHLLHVLALLAMEPPATVEADDLHDRMAEALEATRVWGSDAASASHRARYTAGRIGDRELPAYVDEPGVDAARATETLAQVTLQVGTERWRGVPFVLRSGKALRTRRKEVVVHFRQTRHLPAGFTGETGPRALRMQLDGTAISLDLVVNEPDDPLRLAVAELSTTVSEGRLGAYGEVLADLLDGDPLLSVSGRAAEACWRIVTPVLEAFATDAVPMQEYAAGSAGPDGW